MKGKVKVIALVVAGLFAQNASADDGFLWGGLLDFGYRGANVDGVNRNGAYGNTTPLSATNPLTPFSGPADGAKAQEYQDINSAPIGVVDIRGGSSAMYLRAFGEEFGRDDQYINVVGGGYGMWKASLYNNNIPHQYSFNALSPLNGSGGGLQQVGPGGTYPNALNPANWYTFNYGTQRNTTGANGEFSGKTPWFIRADYNEVKQSGIKPGGAQLGTGSGNGLIELGAPVDQKTQNTTIEGGYNTRQYGFKLAYLDSKFTSSNDAFQWTNFYMRSALDTSLLPPDNDLKKWSLNGYIKQLPWDSAIIARFTQSELTNSLGLTSPLYTSGLKPAGSTPTGQALPPSVGYLLTQPYDSSTNQNLSTFDGKIKTSTANFAWNASPMAKLDTRVYYNYYDKKNDSTTVSYRQGSQGSSCATPPVNSATCYQIGALLEENGEAFSYTRNAAGFDASWSFDRSNKLLGGFDWEKIDRNLAEAPKNDDYKYWIEYRNAGWNNLSGRLKYEFLQRRSDLVNTANPATSINAYYTAYDINNFDANVVKLTLDWTPGPLWFVGFGANWRNVDYKGNFYGRTKDNNDTYDLTVAWGDPDKLRLSAIGNWGTVENNQAYRAVASGQSPLPGGTQTATTYDWGSKNTQDGWMGAVQADWAATDKLMLTASYSYQKSEGGVDLWSGYWGPTCPAAGCSGGFAGGPLVNYVSDNTTLQRFQIKGSYNINKRWAVNAGYAFEKYEYSDGQMAGYGGYYGYAQNLNTAAVGSGYAYFSGAFANPGYTNNMVWLTATFKFDPPPQVYVAPKVAEVAPAPTAKPVAPPPPPATPPAPAPQVQKITLDSKLLFDFDKADLKPEGKAAIDSAVIGKLAQVRKLDVVLVTGHTDRLGSDAYNQKLSERRADAVRNYLVSKGVDKSKIETIGMGEKQPVAQCDQKNRKELIACLQPNRRVDVEVKGETTK